nr:hypothetical protein [uncultured Aminipila sp.]
MKLSINTPLKFFVKENGYVQGEGYRSSWSTIKGTFNNQEIEVFWVEWKSAFGNQVIDAQAIGVNELATVRMPYNPDIYKALKSSEVIVAKNAANIIINGKPDANNPDCYKAFGSTDNYQEKNMFIEFKVKRYEQK